MVYLPHPHAYTVLNSRRLAISEDLIQPTLLLNAASTLQKKEDYGSAELPARKSLHFRKVLGGKTSRRCAVLKNLESMLGRQGKSERAEKIFRGR